MESVKCQRGLGIRTRADGSIEIPLTQGQVAVVDAEDYHLICDRKWYAQWVPCTSSFRAVSGSPPVYMHRVILGSYTDAVVDHANHDTLDNRRSNLRGATRSENQCNLRCRVGDTSKYKGVFWSTGRNKWQARITFKNRCRHLGSFTCEEDAARAYDAAAIRVHGAFAFTNAMAGLL